MLFQNANSTTLSPEIVFYFLPIIFILFSIIVTLVILFYTIIYSSDRKKRFTFFKKIFSYVKISLNLLVKKIHKNGAVKNENFNREGEMLVKINLELARLKEKNLFLEKEVEKEIKKRAAIEEENKNLSSKLEKLSEETKKMSLLGLNSGDTSPHSSWVNGQKQAEESLTGAEKILINEQAAEINRLKDIIREFKEQVQEKESKNEPKIKSA